MSEKIRVLLSEEEVEARIRQIAAKISKDYAGKEIHLICVLKGEVSFTSVITSFVTEGSTFFIICGRMIFINVCCLL